MRRVASNAGILFLTLWLCVAANMGAAQQRSQVQSPILTIDSERMFADSAFGQQTARQFEALGAALAAENRQIEEDLASEEKELTEQRATMDPTEFRVLADAFDEKVQSTRRAQDTKTRDLNKSLEERRVQFLNAAAPVLETIMREAGAAVVMERRSIFLSSNAIDITPMAIVRLDAAFEELAIEEAPEE